MVQDVWLYLNDSSKVVQLDKLRNTSAPGYLSNATVTVTLADAVTGVTIAGETWPLTMAYVNGSNGRYEATLPYDLVVTEGQRLRATITVTHGLLQRVWSKEALVVRDD